MFQGTSDWKMGLGTLMQLYKSGVKLDDQMMTRILIIIGGVNVGMTSANPNPTLQQRSEGMAAIREACCCAWRTYVSGVRKATPVSHWTRNNISHLCIGEIPVDIWTVTPTDQERLAWSRESILESARR
jgi:hypothetical protein